MGEHVDLKTSFRRESNSDMIIKVDTVDKIYQGCSESNVYAAYMTWILILELVLGISQLLVALVSMVVVTTNKPPNGMKKRIAIIQSRESTTASEIFTAHSKKWRIVSMTI